jgi:predicted lipoprotein with Yx(FWY)xxD motif
MKEPKCWDELMRNLRVLAAMPVVVALMIAGCGGSSKSSSTGSASTPPTSASTSSSAASGPYGRSTGTAASRAASTALISTKQHGKLGTILAYGPKKLTVYLFEADKPGSSSCSGACASAWPPVTGKPQAGGAAMSADLGTITRPDGTTQVTYKGHPLYLFVKDKDDGDAYGEALKAFGAEWYVLAPSGNKVDVS